MPYYGNPEVPFETLLGETLASVDGCENGSNEVTFKTQSGRTFKMFHDQDCCEQVSIEDVCGDVVDLIGTPLLQAEESTSTENPEGVTPEYQDSFLWTFYRLATIKGSVVIRWYGESNGYYSESVDFKEIIEQN